MKGMMKYMKNNKNIYIHLINFLKQWDDVVKIVVKFGSSLEAISNLVNKELNDT